MGVRNPRDMGPPNMKAKKDRSSSALLPMDALAVRPYFEDDLAELVAAVPASMLYTLAGMVYARLLPCDSQGVR